MAIILIKKKMLMIETVTKTSKYTVALLVLQQIEASRWEIGTSKKYVWSHSVYHFWNGEVSRLIATIYECLLPYDSFGEVF